MAPAEITCACICVATFAGEPSMHTGATRSVFQLPRHTRLLQGCIVLDFFSKTSAIAGFSWSLDPTPMHALDSQRDTQQFFHYFASSSVERWSGPRLMCGLPSSGKRVIVKHVSIYGNDGVELPLVSFSPAFAHAWDYSTPFRQPLVAMEILAFLMAVLKFSLNLSDTGLGRASSRSQLGSER